MKLRGRRTLARPTRAGQYADMTYRCVFAFCLLSLAAFSAPTLAVAAPDPADAADPKDIISGVWVNDRGSAVTLINTDGQLSGHYNTALGQPDRSQTFPLTGWADGDVLAFTVNFKGYGSMTSWSGQISVDEEGPYMRTLWHLSRDVPDGQEEADLWQSITAGASTFRPVGTP